MQQTDTSRERIGEFAKAIVAGLLVMIITFPSPEWVFSVGIDPPLSWVYNHLFENDLSLGRHIVFPHGPLAFFMYPLPENILLSTAVDAILKLSLVFHLIALLSVRMDGMKYLVGVLIASFISIIAGFNHLVLANLILIYCTVRVHGWKKWRFVAYILTAFAFYVKAYVAILSIVLFASYQVITFLQDRRVRSLLIDASFLAGMLLFFWLMMYGTPQGLINYLVGMVHLAGDNSSAAAFYPHNHWWVLALFMLTVPVLLAMNRTKEFFFYTILIGLSLFAAWKHGMARQDVYHVRGFFAYVVICSVILLVFYQRRLFWNMIILSATCFFLSVSMMDAKLYAPARYEVFRANNFVQFITRFDDLYERSRQRSRKEISGNRLDDDHLDEIGNSSVDVYPWDYSIIPANDLNWQPRVVINSYAAYTSWLDAQNAAHFEGPDAPNYLIVQKTGPGRLNGEMYASIDGRYLWNDEPQTVIELFTWYERWSADDRFLILRRTNAPRRVTSSTTEWHASTWSEWIDVPERANGQLLRARLNFDKSVLQRLKSFLYKDEQFWMYLMLEDESIHKYRIVPKNAVDGLWLNPYVHGTEKEPAVERIMFKASNQWMLSEDISVSWETIDFEQSAVIDSFFALRERCDATEVLRTEVGFESKAELYWNEPESPSLAQGAYEDSFAMSLSPGSYSTTFQYPLDSLPMADLRIDLDGWVKVSGYEKSNDVFMVLSVEDEEEITAWEGIPIDEQWIDSRGWNHVLNSMNYKHVQAGCMLKAYVWNNSDRDVLVDDLRVRIIATGSESVASEPQPGAALEGSGGATTP